MSRQCIPGRPEEALTGLTLEHTLDTHAIRLTDDAESVG